MNAMIETLLVGWDRNLDYAKKLVADLSDEQMVAQPQPGMNHPAWVFCHLHGYHPVIAKLLRGQPFDDPKELPFGMKSKPVADTSVYPSKAELVSAFEQGHADVAAALRCADEALFDRPMSLPRWREAFPKVGSILGYLMLVHESTHLGQLSAWRRVQGLASI